MSKYYRRGKFKNNYLLSATYSWLPKSVIPLNTTKYTACFSNKIGSRCGFVKALIVRGIGYRIFALTNDFVNYSRDAESSFTGKRRPIYSTASEVEFTEEVSNVATDFPYSRYLLVRAGHTQDLVIPLNVAAKALTSKKDRKLVLTGSDTVVVANTAKKVFSYRPPSVYTGRGVRVKHARPIRKAGKKDKQKGKAF